MNQFFVVLTAVISGILFFSLLSSTTTNIHEQGKEIAVLRALGMGKVSPRVSRVFATTTPFYSAGRALRCFD